MDGLDSDIDVTFLLTTNRPEILEPALAARPGRVDLARPEQVIERTEGVTASFLKELIRKAALLACKDEAATSPAAAQAGQAAPIRVLDDHMKAALDELLDTKNQLTRVLLGGTQPGPLPDAPPRN